ncbi:methyltransferase domain-containing protein [Aureimonas psammosilenae]|uniref:methyltransferase domain-containing protein n=1 Tax=Aureimonas psammosilenae TaxID=2495496 RepID=UPI001260E22E|nr:methyltransferase domain-containing protein [Aureimonas psammosilenae]
MKYGLPEFPDGAFQKADRSDDALFYRAARLVTHIDEAAVAALTRFYAGMLPEQGAVLDLMSSWVSHLPDDLALRDVIGHGMNGEELAVNPRLNRWFVQDLNREPVLPLTDESIDAVLCCVGVQYLEQPITVFRDVRRLLRPGGIVIISFSNRCFPTKAVAVWQALDANGQAALVRLYLERAGFAAVEMNVLSDGRNGDPLVTVVGRR